jgi:DNA ligase (NAD+)
MCVALHLVCRDGRLVQAATRGDGREGEDVTHNMLMKRAVQGLPVSVPAAAGDRAMPAEFEVRGEVYITSDDFIQVCMCGTHSLGM